MSLWANERDGLMGVTLPLRRSKARKDNSKNKRKPVKSSYRYRSSILIL
jgi:hypothetical protein